MFKTFDIAIKNGQQPSRHKAAPSKEPKQSKLNELDPFGDLLEELEKESSDDDFMLDGGMNLMHK